MQKKFDVIIAYLFYFLILSVPLVLFPKSSELFEFNKMVLTYMFTTLIMGSWFIRMISEKRLIFKRSILDIPLLLFIFSQFLSTVVSIDSRTSLLGYYSRFNGGLMSTISYSFLYWAFVSNMDRVKTINAIKTLLISATLVSLYGILQHLGIDAHLWVQDVRNRVFSTLGQPNWLAAWLVAIIPITWVFLIYNKSQSSKFKFKDQVWLIASVLLFATIIYTRSRSGLAAFALISLIFWILCGIIAYKLKKYNLKQSVSAFVICNLLFVIIAAVSGTAWTPKLFELINKPTANFQQPNTVQGPALETGGSESGSIRKIVWRGAIDNWKAYPILGSGVETFALSYYKFRPQEHNMVSEWDYLYNKAHNEYLNFAATTGTLGLLSYISLIFFSLLQISNFKFLPLPGTELISKQVPNSKLQNSKIGNSSGQWRLKSFDYVTEIRSISHLSIALVSGYISILITNFFGFSVVPVALLFFLYPAFACTLTVQSEEDKAQKLDNSKWQNLAITQKTIIIFVLCTMLYVLIAIGKYWYADYFYSFGKAHNDAGNFADARGYMMRAVKLSPNESIFWDELSTSTAKISYFLAEQGDKENSQKLGTSAIAENERASDLSPQNVNILRNKANILIELSAMNPELMREANQVLKHAVELAPTEAKIYLNLGLTYLRMGNYDEAISTMKKTIELKPNYYNAHYALALMYVDKGEKEKAKEELNYILEKINPNDEAVQKELNDLEI